MRERGTALPLTPGKADLASGERDGVGQKLRSSRGDAP